MPTRICDSHGYLEFSGAAAAAAAAPPPISEELEPLAENPFPAAPAFPPTPNFTPSPPTLVPITAGVQDNFAQISRRTGVPVLSIQAANPQLVGIPIQAGQRVLIPTGPPQTVAIVTKPGGKESDMHLVG